jgi:hypothetical protein
MKNLIFLCSLIIAIFAQQNSLTIVKQTPLAMSAGFQLVEIKLYLNYIYAVIADGSSFRVVSYDWNNNYSLVSQSSLYPAYMNLTASSTLNPSISVDAALTRVRFHATSTGLTRMLMLPTSDLAGTATLVTHT